MWYSGIGRVTCLELAKYDAKVVIADLKVEDAQQTLELINKQYHYIISIFWPKTFHFYLLTVPKYPKASAIAVKCDVSSTKDAEAMVTATVEKFGRVDYAVNCGMFLYL